MADPISMMAVGGMVASAAGAGVKAFGDIQAGEASSKMYAYKAAVAEQNRRYQLQAGEIARQRSGMKTAQEIGQTTAIQGASNLDVASGSAARVRQSEKDVGIQEQGIITSDAARRAYGEEAEAGLDISASKQAKVAAGIGAAGSLLGGVSSVSDKWLAANKAGVPLFVS